MAADCRTHMEELKEKTSDVLYENYRSDKLMSMGVEQDQTVFKEVKYLPLLHPLRRATTFYHNTNAFLVPP
jgi:septin 7